MFWQGNSVLGLNDDVYRLGLSWRRTSISVGMVKPFHLESAHLMGEVLGNHDPFQLLNDRCTPRGKIIWIRLSTSWTTLASS